MPIIKTPKGYNHGLGNMIFFPRTGNTIGSGVEVKGARAFESAPEASNTDIWADMTGQAYHSIKGATTETVTITSLDYPEEMKTHSLGFRKVGNVLVKDNNAFNQFAMSKEEWYWSEEKGKNIIEVTVYFNLSPLPMSNSSQADEADVTAKEKAFDSSVLIDSTIGTDSMTFLVDPSDTTDPNKSIYDAMHTAGTCPVPEEGEPQA